MCTTLRYSKEMIIRNLRFQFFQKYLFRVYHKFEYLSTNDLLLFTFYQNLQINGGILKLTLPYIFIFHLKNQMHKETCCLTELCHTVQYILSNPGEKNR